MANEKELKDYLYRLLVPPGFRPESNEDIEKTLDVFAGGVMADDMVARILAKANGEIPMYYKTKEREIAPAELTAESEELLALHRGEGDSDSDEVKEKLERYRQLASEDDLDEDETEESESDVD